MRIYKIASFVTLGVSALMLAVIAYFNKMEKALYQELEEAYSQINEGEQFLYQTMADLGM